MEETRIQEEIQKMGEFDWIAEFTDNDKDSHALKSKQQTRTKKQ